MQATCAHCNMQIQPAWSFCPGCGVSIPHLPASLQAPELHPPELHPPEHHPVEPTPVRAAFSGLFFGLIVTPVCLIVGTMLCLTGLGAFLGVPMIIAGILAPIVGPLLGLQSVRGNCPWCDAPVSSLDSTQHFDCDACHHPIAIRDHKFISVA